MSMYKFKNYFEYLDKTLEDFNKTPNLLEKNQTHFYLV